METTTVSDSSRDIWIEAEHWAPGEWTPENDNSDVVVTLKDGSRWSATYFTFSNIALLRESYRTSGECRGGRYFYATNMILVESLTREEVEGTIVDLLHAGEFRSAFAAESAAEGPA
jgi:hypothetical protein